MPATPLDGETAREAALRTVFTATVAPRRVDIRTPAGVVLHVLVEPGGRMQVLGQSEAPLEPAAAPWKRVEPSATDDAAGAVTASGMTPLDDPSADEAWPERDLPWPVPAPEATSTSIDDRRPHELDDDPVTRPRPHGPRVATTPGATAPATTAETPPERRPRGELSGSHGVAAGAVDEGPHTPEAPRVSGRRTTGPAATTEPGDPGDPARPEARRRRRARVRLVRRTSEAPRPEAGGLRAPASDVTTDDVGQQSSTPPPTPARPRRRQDAPRPAPLTARSTQRRWSLPGTPRARRAVASTAALLAVGLGVATTIFPTDEGPERPIPTVVTSPEPFPGTPPDGLGTAAAWAGPVLAADSPVAVTPDGDALALATATGALAVVDAATGRTRWSVDLPDGVVSRGPVRSRVQGTDAVVVQTGNRVGAYAMTDGAVLVETEIPAGGRLVLDGPAPLLRIGETRAAVLDETGFQSQDLPPGSRALLAREDGTILAGDSRGWWHLRRSEPAGAPTPWEQMGSTADRPTRAPRVVAALGSSVVLLDPDPARPRLLVHEDGESVRASFQGDHVPAARPVWAPSPSGTWGILGRSLIDARAGQVTDLGDWETVLIADDRAYGLIGDSLHVAGPGRAPAPVRTRTALVEATTGAGPVVRGDTGAGPRVWLLRPSSS